MTTTLYQNPDGRWTFVVMCAPRLTHHRLPRSVVTREDAEAYAADRVLG